MNKYTITALLANKSGVLTRLSGLFARRGFNIDSISACATEDANFSRVTIVLSGDESGSYYDFDGKRSEGAPRAVAEDLPEKQIKKRGRPKKASANAAGAPKKRGRPKKASANAAGAPKKRGRPKKASANAAGAPKKRGRPKKQIT